MKDIDKTTSGNNHKHIIPKEVEPVSACCGGDGHSHLNESSNVAEIYFCPMKCEGDKTYNEPGNCPVCNMNLVIGSESNKHEKSAHKHIHHKEDHTKHQHKNEHANYYCPMHCEGEKVYPEPGDCPECECTFYRSSRL
ncbi:MAG: hypothetical protein L3J54_05685 [Draconibacterium sp.]|nr:hypothetical protein [Draconibacterium sp.]